MTWIKICGTTNLEDALTAVAAGADALGFVFYEKSPRKIDPEAARQIVVKLPPEIETVGVFVDQAAEQIREIVEHVGLTAVQLYDRERAEALSSHYELASATNRRRPKIIFVVPGNDLADAGGIHLKDASFTISKSFRNILFALLVDSNTAEKPGGTGTRFDWIRTRGIIAAMNECCPTIVAGGLDPINVAVALALLHNPWGVDVASGVEARPGKKDPEKVRAFINAARKAGN
ncbi:MAG: phosphoribosylanthranilate isomerase [Terriglobales bacterium]